MITGTISNRRAYISLFLRSTDGQAGDFEFVLDTGFTGFLTLPPSDCAALGLTFDRLQPSFLADRTPVLLRVYIAVVLWDDEEREVEILAMQATPLLGMSLLEGSDVRIQSVEGGMVTIERL